MLAFMRKGPSNQRVGRSSRGEVEKGGGPPHPPGTAENAGSDVMMEWEYKREARGTGGPIAFFRDVSKLRNAREVLASLFHLFGLVETRTDRTECDENGDAHPKTLLRRVHPRSMFGGALDDDATEPRVPVVRSAIVCHEEPLKTGQRPSSFHASSHSG